MFTLTDKTLLDRAARMINAAAKELRLQYEAAGWASTEAGRKAKQEYDRLLRDERDMRALGKRLCLHFDVKAAARGMEAASTVLGTAAPVGDVTKVQPLDLRVSQVSQAADPAQAIALAIAKSQKPGFNCPECGTYRVAAEIKRCSEHDGGGLLGTTVFGSPMQMPAATGSEVHDG